MAIYGRANAAIDRRLADPVFNERPLESGALLTAERARVDLRDRPATTSLLGADRRVPGEDRTEDSTSALVAA